MPDLHAVIRSRRSIHHFTAQPVPAAAVHRALDVARWAPNHRLTEPWRFYLLGPETAAAVAAHNAELVRVQRGDDAAENKFRRWAAMPGWLVVTAQVSEDPLRHQEDYAATCCAVQNFMLALWSEGIGTKWTTGPVTRDAGFYRLLDLDPAREYVVALLWYGYPAEVPVVPRKPLDALLFKKP